MRINSYSLNNSSDHATAPQTFKKLLASLIFILGSTYMSFAQPAAPVATAADNFTCTSFNANWQVVPGALSYSLDVSTDLSFATFLTSFNNVNVGNVLNYTVSGLNTNTNYYYRVRAYDGSNISLNSNTILANTGASAAPNALAASNVTCTTFDANWNTVSGAINYFIDVSTSASFSTFLTGYNNLNVVGGSTTTVNISGLTANTTYYYRLRTDNGCSTSIHSNVISVLTGAPIAPIALAASNFTCTSMNVNWSASSGAISYSIDISTDQNFNSFLSPYNNFNAGNVTTLLVTGLMTNTTYYYRVRSNNGCSTSLNSNTISVSTTASAVPTGLQLTNTGCSFADISWTPVNNAVTYFLDVSLSPTFTSLISGYNNFDAGGSAMHTITGLTANGTYYFRMRSSNGCSSSNNSTVITFSTLSSSPPNAPTALTATNINCSSFNANWTSVSGATGYIIDVSTSSSFTSFVGSYNNMNVGNVLTFNVSGLLPNTTYYYMVRTIDGCGTSVNSNIISVNSSGADAPIALNSTFVTCVSFDANWSAVAGALSYSIDVSTDASFGTFMPGFNDLNVGNVTTYNITGLSVNTTYYYRVRVTNSCATSISSNIITVSTSAPAVPVATSASNLICTSFNANWSAVSGALAYILDVSTDPTFGTFIPGYNSVNVGNTTTYYIPGLQLNGTYYYRIRASNGCATSIHSNTITVNTAAGATLSSSLTPPAIFTDHVFNYTPTSVTPGTTFSWTRSAVTGISNASAFGTDDPNEVLYNTATSAINVTYVYTLTAGGCTNPTTYSVVVTVNTPAVWPGDANNDSLVNNIDLLSVGLYYSQTGSPRSTVDNTWQAYVANNWLTLQTNGQDIKHADCNGDGTIDSNDTLAINLNFSLTHAISAPPVVFHADERATSDMYFVISSSAYTAGDWVDVELWLGSQATPLSGLYGIAFDIDYDASFVQSGTEAITYQPSWLGTPGTDVLTINQVDPLTNKAYGAVTRTDQVGRNGYGKIATFKFQVKNSLSSVDTMHFAITSYMAIDSVGVTRTLTTAIDSIGVNPLSTGIQAKTNAPKVNIAPNPFVSNTTISFNTEVKNANVKVIDILGKEVKTLTFTGQQLILEKGELKAGIYSVKIVSENNTLIATEKIVVQ